MKTLFVTIALLVSSSISFAQLNVSASEVSPTAVQQKIWLEDTPEATEVWIPFNKRIPAYTKSVDLPSTGRLFCNLKFPASSRDRDLGELKIRIHSVQESYERLTSTDYTFQGSYKIDGAPQSGVRLVCWSPYASYPTLQDFSKLVDRLGGRVEVSPATRF